MTTISLRLDDEMKRELDQMCNEMGMSLTTFFTIYAKRALRDRRIPFEITAPQSEQAFDPEMLDWDQLREEVLAAEAHDSGAEAIPWGQLREAMREKIHGTI